MFHIMHYALVCLLIYLMEYINSGDAGWSHWSEWSSCSATCGSRGTMKRNRYCNTLTLFDDGKDCEGPKLQTRACTSQPCTGVGEEGWSQWSEWSSCSVTCGPGGTMKRNRSCKTPPSLDDGKSCQGPKIRARVCMFSQPCPEMQCVDPPNIPNANYKLHGRKNNLLIVGATATYTCDPGYELKNSTDSVLTCARNLDTNSLEWRGEMPRCIEFKCGVRLGKKIGRGKVVGGHPATDPWPWMAALYFVKQGFTPAYHCGGSIISERFILTAAHCFYTKDYVKRSEMEILVKLGLTNVRNESSLQEFEVEKIIIHPDYRPGQGYDYDIALLQLETPIEFNSLIRPICLPPRKLSPHTDFYKPREYVVAIGWGITRVLQLMAQAQDQLPEQLKEIILPIQSSQRCQKREGLLLLLPQKAFSDRMFCAGDGRGGNDTCSGDSGGPAMQSQLDEDNRIYWTQVGIVSWGLGCGLPGTYGYYTHVQKLVDWVIRNITPKTEVYEE